MLGFGGHGRGQWIGAIFKEVFPWVKWFLPWLVFMLLPDFGIQPGRALWSALWMCGPALMMILVIMASFSRKFSPLPMRGGAALCLFLPLWYVTGDLERLRGAFDAMDPISASLTVVANLDPYVWVPLLPVFFIARLGFKVANKPFGWINEEWEDLCRRFTGRPEKYARLLRLDNNREVRKAFPPGEIILGERRDPEITYFNAETVCDEFTAPLVAWYNNTFGKTAKHVAVLWHLAVAINRFTFPRRQRPGKAEVITWNPVGSMVLIAPPGSGKFIAFVAANARSWTGILITLDSKREIEPVISRYRREVLGQRVFTLDPNDPNTDRINVMDRIPADPDSPELVPRCAALANRLLMRGGAAEKAPKDPFWENSGVDLTTGVLAYVATSPTIPHHKRNITTLPDLLSLEPKDLIDLIDRICRMDIAKGAVTNLIGGFRGFPENTFGGVRAQVKSVLGWLANEKLARLVSGDSFRTDELARDTKITINNCLPFEVMRDYPGAVRCILEAYADPLIAARGSHAGRSFWLLDEAKVLKDWALLTTAFSQLRGSGFVMAPVYQDLSQIKGAFGDAFAEIINGAECQLWMNPTDLDTCKYLSDSLGVTRRWVPTFNESMAARTGLGMLSTNQDISVSKGGSWQEGPLRTPDQLQTMRDDHVIVIKRGARKAILGKCFYFLREEWQGDFDRNPYFKG